MTTAVVPQWENECILLHVCPSRGPGSLIPTDALVLHGIFSWLITLC